MGRPASTLHVALRSILPLVAGLPLLWLLNGALSSFVEIILITAAINVVLAVSLNVVNGFTGQFSLGHAGFMAVGAYTAAKVSLALAGVRIGFLPPVVADQVFFAFALASGMGMAALAGFLVGMPSRYDDSR